MSVEFAHRFRRDAPRSSLRDLEDAVLLVAVPSEDGDLIPAGTEGTIVSVHDDGAAYIVEFAEPEGALAAVGPDETRRVEPTAPRPTRRSGSRGCSTARRPPATSWT